MSINISYNKGIGEKNIKNYVLFSDEDFKIFGLKKLSISKITNQINNTINSNKSKKKNFITFNINPKKKITLVKIKKNQN